MNKYCFIFLLLIIPLFSISQNIKGGLIAGFNMTQVDGDEIIGFHKYGLNAGATSIVPLGKNFSASIEALYTQKGSNQKANTTDSINGQYKLILNYVEVPVLFSYTDKDIIKAGAGFSWGRLVQFKEWANSNRVNWTTPDGPYNSSDIDMLIDLQLKLFAGFYFDFRKAYSMAKIRTRVFHNLLGQEWTRKQFNNDLSFRLIYIFKDKPSPKKTSKDVDKIK
jgi:hypothetical protein